MMGWSHGGFITAHLALPRRSTPFKAGAAIVPVTNLVFRLVATRGRATSELLDRRRASRACRSRSATSTSSARRSIHVDNLKVPLLVHVATNDDDVNFVENQQIVYTLRALKPDLAETKIYVDPAAWGRAVGHTFSRRVESDDARARRLAGADRLVEPHLGVLRVEPAAVRGPVEAGRACKGECGEFPTTHLPTSN